MFSRGIVPFTLALGPLMAVEAVCEVYMSEAQSTQVLFPGQSFTKKSLRLTPDELKSIEKDCGEAPRTAEVTYWRSAGGDTVFIDRVLGKHEYITYAVGIDHGGKIKGIEILEYRESYGAEIRRSAWRAQFVGKDIYAPLRSDDDIKNISGATISSNHVTRGVNRVMHTHALITGRL